jgi:hypothetical protein
VHARRISQLNILILTMSRHGWDTSLPGSAMFHSEDYPKRGRQLPRALAEHVMTQFEDSATLDRWTTRPGG